MSLNALRRAAAALTAAWLGAAAAHADVAGFLGDWSNPEPGPNSVMAKLTGSEGYNTSGILRVVVTPVGTAHVRIQVFGRCDRGSCDWGAQIGRNHSGAPNSDEVRSVAADFNTGYAILHLTLRPSTRGTLRFDAVTDFTDRSGHHDFETNGGLVRFSSASMAAAAPPAPYSAAPAAPYSAAPAAPYSAVPPAPYSGGRAAPTALRFAEDCVAVDSADAFVAPAGRSWQVRDFLHTIVDFGSDKLAAAKTAKVLKYYNFDEQCYVRRPRPHMIYWRTAGEVPHVAIPGADCAEVHPANVQAAQLGGAWKVVDGRYTLLNFDDDRAGAAMAVSVIQAYQLNRECFVSRPDLKMVYWLSL